MRTTILLVALCSALTGCTLFKDCGCGDNSDGQSLAASPAASRQAGDEQWWRASVITPKSAMRNGVFIANQAAAPKADNAPSPRPGTLPPDLNNGKSFWEPDREFDYLYANYEHPKQAWWRDYWNLKYFPWEDTKALAKPKYLITLGIGAALAGATRPLDHGIARHFEHTDILHGGVKAGNNIGNPATHFMLAGAMYAYGLAANDDPYRKRSLILLEGLAYNGLVTLALKAAFERETPNGKRTLGIKDSFPSGHVSSTFAMAAMLDEMYGHKVGYPLYLLGGYVALSRLNDQDHYLSDCVFGAFLGYAIGKAVFEKNELELFGFKLEPLIVPETGAMGLSLTHNF